MRLQRTIKEGTPIKFKWYDNYRDYWENKDNFRVVEGIVQENTFMNEVIVYNEQENITYCVNYEDVIN